MPRSQALPSPSRPGKALAPRRRSTPPGLTPAGATAGEADTLYAALMAGATDQRRAKSLKAVWSALEHLRQMGVSTYTVSGVARAMSALGVKGPQEQSMRNRSGGAFRDLIAAYERQHGRPATPKPTREDDLVGGIPDPRIAAEVRLLVAANRSLSRRNDMLHRALSQLSPVAISKNGDLQPAALPFPSRGRVEIGKEQVRAFRELLRYLTDRGHRINEETGALMEEGGEEIAGPGFAQLVECLSQDNS